MPRLSFTEHPASVGETYLEHMGMALSFAGSLALAAAACLMHAILPFAFERTGSRAVERLYRRMVTHRAKTPARSAPKAAGTGLRGA